MKLTEIIDPLKLSKVKIYRIVDDIQTELSELFYDYAVDGARVTYVEANYRSYKDSSGAQRRVIFARAQLLLFQTDELGLPQEEAFVKLPKVKLLHRLFEKAALAAVKKRFGEVKKVSSDAYRNRWSDGTESIDLFWNFYI